MKKGRIVKKRVDFIKKESQPHLDNSQKSGNINVSQQDE